MPNFQDADFEKPPVTADCWFLTGATAAGKTGVGLELARLLDAEIVSLDSMAVYRGMDIGTAKPTAQQRREVPHHLIDIAEPTEEFSVSQYLEAAEAKVAEIRSRGRTPLFVGGTPLYLKTLLRGLFEGPPADWEFRRAVEEEAAQVGVEALHERLAQVDPVTAARLHPNDRRRIIRALEVYRTTGQPISHFQFQFDEGRPARDCRVFVLQWPRSELHRRIDRRVESMFAAGLIEEVRGLLDKYGDLGRTASQAVGYREAIEHLAGKLDLAETIRRTQARTRRFARRQETWFRSLSECRFAAMKEKVEPAEIALTICATAEAPT
ncbi:MAG: tRNA (adenosine(37)-N6)-dimethylallyltransferase MiaA [Planctomycetes bacterium]|nr:tRNA (adenosine(37)-N6)-dimethylallyltransferase MiaA [Planctomycetota bacterium]